MGNQPASGRNRSHTVTTYNPSEVDLPKRTTIVPKSNPETTELVSNADIIRSVSPVANLRKYIDEKGCEREFAVYSL